MNANPIGSDARYFPQTHLVPDEAQPEVVSPGEHLRVQLLAHQPEQVQHDELPNVADLIPQVCVTQHSLLKQK